MMILWAVIALGSAPANACALTEADKRANRKLTFEQFDQSGTLASSARQLNDRKCYDEAAKATEDYLINGPVASDRQQRILHFHLGQQLASAGREREAARVIAGTRHPPVDGAPESPLRWDDFARGVWAFLVKDRLILKASIAAAKAGEGRGNQLNASFLEGLDHCFNKPYSEAIIAPCRTLPPELSK